MDKKVVMEYIDTKLYTFKDRLQDSIVIFEYKKTNGQIRKAKGTFVDTVINKVLPELTEDDVRNNPNLIKLEKKVVDIVIKEHEYEDILEYAFENNVTSICFGDDDEYYYFLPIRKKHKLSDEQVLYFDLDKKDYRSFKKDNFLGILDIIKIDEQNVDEEGI